MITIICRDELLGTDVATWDAEAAPHVGDAILCHEFRHANDKFHTTSAHAPHNYVVISRQWEIWNHWHGETVGGDLRHVVLLVRRQK